MAGDSPQMSALPEAVQVRRALHVGEALLQPSVANEAGASALGKGGLCVLPPTHRTCEKKNSGPPQNKRGKNRSQQFARFVLSVFGGLNKYYSLILR